MSKPRTLAPGVIFFTEERAKPEASKAAAAAPGRSAYVGPSTAAGVIQAKAKARADAVFDAVALSGGSSSSVSSISGVFTPVDARRKSKIRKGATIALSAAIPVAINGRGAEHAAQTAS
eukprot:CAMPEP_0197354788 /NCGR_PEP_ID=MMETSP0893-20130614/44243_1 /TAXON_ID=44058 ORGANISM="Aureoumbra lagunensis, Strain CCMP1510" /NCGR_SAMPLE_ID=MMETSP0893 /ASSEMBLY_ACC=CAM_ASM_000539 /LENGTH=118 /DNA_ID=CAMNT_0042871217 /DNA_START=539 /DNA_END=895 /DNA_ORIENTATION=-